ncbi:Sugar transport protein [Melia azedarach]|uniref:Sugar transport protein n=1 Tax=Melia azedarach TaxID=155640 RepID=A0ACC1XZ55_MELAZ|nr:Sugar transport protein [Melia azedarach]
MRTKSMGAKQKQVIVVYDEEIGSNADGKLTAPVLIICIVVASAGVMFGYESGIYGGVMKTEAFLKQFFPSVLRRATNEKQDQFCVYDSKLLVGYISSLYVAGIFSALLAGRLTTSAGRKGALIIGGMVYFIGVSLHALAVNLPMLMLGRSLIGFGLGFTNQAAPIYLVEIAPTKLRGAIGTGFPLFFEIGVFIAKWIVSDLDQYKSTHENFWRFAACLSGLPAIVMTIIAFFIPDTPSSLIQRGKIQEALRSLNQVRSIDVDTENELQYLINYHEAMKDASEKPYQMLFEMRYRPQLLLIIGLPFFRQFTGIHLISNFWPILYRSLAFNAKQTADTIFAKGIICFFSVILAAYLIDRIGRKCLLLEGGIQMFICHVALAIIMATDIGTSGNLLFSERSAFIGLILVMSANAAFSWSWGTLNWILPSEMLSMEVRPAGQGLFLAFNLLCQFFIVQSVYPMLCIFKYWAFLFYAGWMVIMTIFVILFVPETKNIPLESMDVIWRSHWYWSRFVHGTNSLLKPEINQ